MPDTVTARRTGEVPRPVPSALSAARRRADLDRLGNGWRPDVLVIGAGFTGCGVALDAVTRGLSVAVVDVGDLGSGTSGWSSKLVHGGLRYLASGDVRLAWESAVERGVLMERTAPHLTRALPFLTPIGVGASVAMTALVGLGYLAGDVLRLTAGTAGRTLPSPRWVSSRVARRLAPTVRTAGAAGALVNTDGQVVDDVRLVVALARTAAAFGARVLPYVGAAAVERTRAELRDEMTGETFTATAGRVVVAAGVWSDTLDDRVALRPSRGAHLVIDGAALGHPTAGITAPVPGHPTRFVFLLPQPDGRVYLGLTDEEAGGPIPREASVTPEEQAFLLDVAGGVLTRPLAPDAVLGGFVGYRPLVQPIDASGARGSTPDLSRRHLVVDDGEGPITVVGGKLTTYRAMAAQTVDRLTDRPGRTRSQPLVGALPRARLAAWPEDPWLVARYGAEASVLSSMMRDEPSLAEPVVPGLPYRRAEFRFAVDREGALTVDDLVDRRTRLGLVRADRVLAAPVAASFVP
ncbi:glycerol-3-phosphate dehydrogenase/oxidase [Euzebya tangerina]|uniref:glycerol-3-phosphate dehydrogenase/oxidase n=1 Tax=Euzebya tangerina TaxID=591198 RepID=UPI000E31D005|nr:glycerol-3-phosphate dehydrogenase/oxidase [Euzebya tangerina]